MPDIKIKLPLILANTVWSGAFPLGFKFFGLHVIAELPLEALVIWLFTGRREHLVRVFGWVLLANVASFVVGVFALTGFSVPKISLAGTAGVWLVAFLVSWAVEGYFLRRWLQVANSRTIWRAVFWGNVVSYTMAAVIFIAWIKGIRIPWPVSI